MSQKATHWKFRAVKGETLNYLQVAPHSIFFITNTGENTKLEDVQKQKSQKLENQTVFITLRNKKQ